MVYKDKVITECRLCFSTSLIEVIDFGRIALGNNLHKKIEQAEQAKTYPLCLLKCDECNHFQLSFSVNPINLYANNYTYTSSIAASFVRHLNNSAEDILKHLSEKNKKYKVLEVGSNDGTALIPFKEKGCFVLGVDPAKIPSQIANKKGIKTINKFFSKDLSIEIIKQYENFDIVISHNVLAHVENLHDVFEGIYNILKDDGVLIFEIGYFKSLIDNIIFDTIYHEHLDYHTKIPLVYFLRKKGFSIEKIEENNIQGGSIRLYCKKNYSASVSLNVQQQLDKESKSLNELKIKGWKNKINLNIDKIKSIIDTTIKSGGSIYGLGATTKATLILGMLGNFSNHIKLIVDDNYLKVNKFTSTIPILICSELPANMSKNDLIICFAWNFYEELFKKLKNTTAKGCFLNVNNTERRYL